MEKNGILARRDSKTDKRQQIVFLTEKGNRMKTQAAEIPNCMVANLQSCALDFQKLDTIIPLLDEFIEKMRNKNKQE